MSAITTVPFHNQNLLLIEHNERPYVAMKPIVEGMGLAWTSQREKIKANTRRWAVELLNSPTEKDGKTYSMISMPLLKLPAFMASIHPSRVKAELRETIELYQDECDNALADYWFKGQATNPRIERISPEQKGELQQIMSARCAKVPSDMQGKARSSLWGQLNNINGVSSYHDTPASQFEESKRLLESLTILKGVVVEQKAIEHKQAHVKNKRFLLSYDDGGHEHMMPIQDNACVMTPEQMLKALQEPNGIMVSDEALVAFAVATIERLHAVANFYKQKTIN